MVASYSHNHPCTHSDTDFQQPLSGQKKKVWQEEPLNEQLRHTSWLLYAMATLLVLFYIQNIEQDGEEEESVPT